jgi:tetratricopeptide (TPR) repeat protein
LLRIGSKTSTKITGFFDIKLPFIQAWNTFIRLIQWYISKLFYPVDVLWMWEEKLAVAAIDIVNLAILCGWMLFLIYILWKKREEAWGFALVIFSAGFLPAFLASFTYTPKIKTALIELHWFGYASTGFFLLIAYGLSRLQKVFPRKIFAGFMVGLVVLLAGRTYYTNRLWKDDKTYCSYWLMINSMNAAPWEALARRYILENQDKHAWSGVELANFGLMWHLLHHAEKAYQYYDAALKMDKQCAAAYYGLAMLYTDLSQYEIANRAFARAKEIQPEYDEAYRLLAQLFIDQGEKDYGRRIKEIIDRAGRVETKEKGEHKLTGGEGIAILFP